VTVAAPGLPDLVRRTAVVTGDLALHVTGGIHNVNGGSVLCG